MGVRRERREGASRKDWGRDERTKAKRETAQFDIFHF